LGPPLNGDIAQIDIPFFLQHFGGRFSFIAGMLEMGPNRYLGPLDVFSGDTQADAQPFPLWAGAPRYAPDPAFQI
jgi:hypothetical protein